MNAEARDATPTDFRGGYVVPFWNCGRRIDETPSRDPRYPVPNLVDLAKQPDVLVRLHAMLSD